VDQQHSRRVKELFDNLRERPAHERARVLESLGSDPASAALRADVELLLNALAEAGEFLESPTGGGGSAAEEVPASGHEDGPDGDPGLGESGSQVGPYTLLRQLGEGGFGVVYLAQQEHPIRRRVAIKIIKLGLETNQVIARFEQERQALAMMDHPHIARVLDVGSTPAGRPYFAMELVHGEPITTFCDKKRMSIPERLQLFAKVCHAVQHAHQKGIIHRDLKPSNVLVTVGDGDTPIPKVIDFGIAKATQARLTEKTLFTDFRQMIGTPAYMSPEQAGMGAAGELDIDTRSDVYALGALLYELLTGVTPFDAQRLRSAAFGELQRIIREDDPPRPSTRVSTEATIADIAARRQIDPKRLGLLVRGELDWVVMRCLEKDRTRRYATADDLADDLDRYLKQEALEAGPPTRAYRVRKFIRRNKIGVGAGSLLAGAVLLGAGGTTAGLLQAQRANTRLVTTNIELDRSLAETIRSRDAEVQQRQLAEAEATRAALAEAEAESRSLELEQVAEFQAAQLSQIDVMLMGTRLRASIIEKKQAALAGTGLEAQEIEEAVQALDRSLRDINFTNVALETLDENIFEQALKVIDEKFESQPRISAFLVQTIASTLRDLGMLHRAIEPQTRALEIHRRTLGDDHPSTLSSINNMGALLLAQGRYAEVEPYYRQSLEGARRTLGDDHPNTLISINNMGNLLLNLGKWAEAEVYFREALEGQRRTLGDEHPGTLNSINLMGGLLSSQGRNTEAEPFIRQALDARRRTLGDEHPGTLKSIHGMGLVLEGQGKHAEAEPYFREAMEGYRRTRGEKQASTIDLMAMLALCLIHQNTPEKAIESEGLLRQLLEIRTEALAQDHWVLANTRSMLGGALLIQGRALLSVDTAAGIAKLTEARSLLVDGYEGMSPPPASANRKAEALQRVIELFDTLHIAEPDQGHDAQAEAWRGR
jgi:eukaryotic-like serine/threonine-protein kinase